MKQAGQKVTLNNFRLGAGLWLQKLCRIRDAVYNYLWHFTENLVNVIGARLIHRHVCLLRSASSTVPHPDEQERNRTPLFRVEAQELVPYLQKVASLTHSTRPDVDSMPDWTQLNSIWCYSIQLYRSLA